MNLVPQMEASMVVSSRDCALIKNAVVKMEAGVRWRSEDLGLLLSDTLHAPVRATSHSFALTLAPMLTEPRCPPTSC